MNNSLYFNFYSGVSGDMLLGSLIDLGVDIDILKKILNKIDKRLSIKTKNVTRGLNRCKQIEPVIPSLSLARIIEPETRTSRTPLVALRPVPAIASA